MKHLIAGEHRPTEQLENSRAMRGIEHQIGSVLDALNGVGDRRPDFDRAQQRQIVLGIPNRDRVMPRDAEIGQRLEHAAALGDASGDDHQLAAVADELTVEPEALNLMLDGDRVNRRAGEDHLTTPKRHSTRSQRATQTIVHTARQCTGEPGRGQHGSVLGDHLIKVVSHVGEHHSQLRQDPSGHQHERHAGAPRCREPAQHLIGRASPVCQRAVEVGRQRPKGPTEVDRVRHVLPTVFSMGPSTWLTRAPGRDGQR